jgi:FtsH-binding integral membrane protein
MSRVHRNVACGIGTSAIVAIAVADTGMRNVFFSMGGRHPTLTGLGWIALLAPLAMLLAAAFADIGSWGARRLRAFYLAFTAAMGIGCSAILVAYPAADVVAGFAIAAVSFGALSAWGGATRRDLSGLGAACMMGLVGIILVCLVGGILGLGVQGVVCSAATVLVFAGLTASDTQDAKRRFMADPADGDRIAVWSALELYLDLVNLIQQCVQLVVAFNDDD